MRLPALALAVAVLALGCPSTPPAVSCDTDAECSGGRCLDKLCYAHDCEGAACATGQVCANGSCVDELCVGQSCAAGETCLKGSCLPTTCTTQTCGTGQVCENEACADARCIGIICPQGQACLEGVCTTGATCGGLLCAADQVCAQSQCVDSACLGVQCGAGTRCVQGLCMSTACDGVTCDGGVCQGGACVETACVGVACDGGTTCSAGSCVEPACVGVACDGGTTCSAGSCVDTCTVSCAAPCPTCPNGRSCQGGLECDSRLCASGTCTACSSAMNDCPNGGICQNGICRSGLKGPCLSTLDCQPAQGLTCENGECRLTQGSNCTMDDECVASLKCVNLVCNRPRCQLQLLETQTVPGRIWVSTNQAVSLSPQGELFVTHGQWGSTYANTFVRRFRVAPGSVQEQDPKAPMTLMALADNDPNPFGHADAPGTGWTSNLPAPERFIWYAGSGAFDGVRTVEIQFTNFNNDIRANLYSFGRFAKCGDSFFFAVSNTTSGGKAMLRFQTPAPVGSGTTAQVLTASVARRDTWPLTQIMDIDCSANALYVLGADGTGVKLQRLGYDLVAQGPPLAIPGSALNGIFGDWGLAVVDDQLQFAVSRAGVVQQVSDGGVSTLSNIGNLATDWVNASTPDTIVFYDHTTGMVRRYGRRMMDGSVPPLDLDCQWQ